MELLERCFVTREGGVLRFFGVVWVRTMGWVDEGMEGGSDGDVRFSRRAPELEATGLWNVEQRRTLF